MKKVLFITMFALLFLSLFAGCSTSGRISLLDGSFTHTYHPDDYYDSMHTSDPPLIDLD